MPSEPMNPLARAFTVRSLLRFACPTMVMMVFMGLYTLADTVFVARYVNTDALSALNIVCPVVNLIVGLGTMLAAGGSAVVARRMGAGEMERASQDFTLLTLAGAGMGALIAGVGAAWTDEIVAALGASERLFPYCREYLRILLLFTPASMLQILFQNLIVAAGRPGMGMLLGMGAGAVNILLDALLMARFRMGIGGAALGTGLGYLAAAAVGLAFFASPKGRLRFTKPAMEGRVLAESLSNGFSEMVSQAASAVTTFLFNAAMMRLAGEEGVAAITVMIYTQFGFSSLYIGFSMGVAPVISYNEGRGDGARLRSVFSICARVIAALSAALFGAAVVFGSSLAGVFAPRGTPVYALARRGLLLFSPSFLLCGWNIFASAALTALSNGKLSAILSFSRTFGWLVALLLLLPRLIGVTGVFLAVPLAELLTLASALAYWKRSRGRGQASG